MSSIKQDKYILGQSVNTTVVNIGQEIRIDLTLQDNTNVSNNMVYGVITDVNNTPISNALVKLMSQSYDPIGYTFSDNTGKYSFQNIKANVGFYVFAIAEGYDLSQSNLFTVGSTEKKVVDLVLIKDNNMILSVIAGDILDSVTTEPVNEAVVSLFSNNNGNLTLMGITYTNEYGQYTFRELQQGNYKVTVSALGYNDQSGTVSINKNGQIISFNLGLTKNLITSNGTISGIILDDNNIPIVQSEVILYSVNSPKSRIASNNSLTPVAFTTTNKNGIYLFGNVISGTYLISANKLETIIIPVESDGTVSGVILDSSNNPISNADVILCEVINQGSSNETSTPIAYTTTDVSGAYLFTGVPIGNFIVKATKVTLVTIS